MPETSGTKMGSDTKSPSGGSKGTTTGGGSGAGRGPGGSMAASKASSSRGSSEGARQGGGTSGNTSASRGPGGSMAAAKASSNPSGASRNTQTTGPNRGLAGTSSQSGAATAKASAPQQSRGIVKDQSRVPASAQVSTPRNMVEQARINNLRDQYARYGEAYRTIAPPPALPGAPGSPRVLNPQRDVAMSSLPGPGTTWPGQGNLPQGKLTAIQPAQPGIADRIVSAFTGPSTLGQRTPQPTSRFANPAQPASAAQMAAPPPQAGLSSARVPRLPAYQVIGATIQNILNNGPMPGSPVAKLNDWWNGASDSQPDLSRNLSDAMRRYNQTAGQAVAGDPRFADRQEWTQYKDSFPVVNGELMGARADPRLSLSQYASGPQVMKDQARVPQGTVVPAGGPAPAAPSMAAAGPFSISPDDPASQRYAGVTRALSQRNRQPAQAGSQITIPGGDLPVAAGPSVPSWRQSLYAGEDMPYPAGPEGQGQSGTSGPAAPSQQAGQPQSIGEALNRVQYEKDRASEKLSSLPQRILEAVLGGNISGNTILGPRDAERGDKGNREMNQLLLDEINRILATSAPATSAPASTSRPAVAGPNQSQLDLVLNTFL